MLIQRWKKKTARQGSRIMRGEQRLLQAPLKRVVHTLYTLVDCAKADFTLHYLPVLQRFAQCCQAMPVHQGDEPYSLFLQGYERARHALAIQRGYCLSGESPSAMAVTVCYFYACLTENAGSGKP